MKYLYLLLVGILSATFGYSQTANRGTLEYNGQKYPCYTIEYNLPEEEVENVIKSELKLEGYQPDKSKGFLVYRGVRLKNLDGAEAHDIIFKIEKKSRKESDKSIVSMITAKAGEIPRDKVKDSKSMSTILNAPNSAAFLNSFQNTVDIQSYNLALDAQAKEVSKAEKKLESLQKDQTKLEKKIKDLQDELATNQKNQELQAAEISSQKKILEQKVADKPGKQ